MPMQWAVVADRNRARIFARVSVRGNWQDIDDITRRTIEPNDDGREQRLPPLTPQLLVDSSIRREAGRNFIEMLAERLTLARKRGDFDQLILVAPGELLQELKSLLDAGTRRRLVDAAEADMAGLPLKTTRRELARLF